MIRSIRLVLSTFVCIVDITYQKKYKNGGQINNSYSIINNEKTTLQQASLFVLGVIEATKVLVYASIIVLMRRYKVARVTYHEVVRLIAENPDQTRQLQGQV